MQVITLKIWHLYYLSEKMQPIKITVFIRFLSWILRWHYSVLNGQVQIKTGWYLSQKIVWTEFFVRFHSYFQTGGWFRLSTLWHLKNCVIETPVFLNNSILNTNFTKIKMFSLQMIERKAVLILPLFKHKVVNFCIIN